MRVIYLILFIWLLSVFSPAQTVTFGQKSGISEKLEKYMQAQAEVYGFGGTVLVVKDNKVLLKKAYGLADFEWNTPNTVDTKFSLASVSKQFTAAAILQLAERGKLSVEDKLSRFFPDFPKADKVTIHMLLTHSSGLANDFKQLYMKRTDLTRETAIPLLAQIPYDFEPGEKFGYSNIGYLLLACIVEKVSGESFPDYMNKHIFEPLEMKNSGISTVEAIVPKLARIYFRPEGVFIKMPYHNWKLNIGHNGVYSTVEDLYKWDRALYGMKILSEASKKKMETPYIDDYGYGVGIFPLHNHRIVTHIGRFGGTSTTLNRFTDDNMFIAILSNNEGGPGASSVSYGLSAIVLGLDVELPYKRKEIKINTSVYDRYVGKYGTHEIVKSGDKLIYKNSGAELRPESGTKFFFAENPTRSIEFIADKESEINSLIMTISGVKTTFERSK